MPVIADPSFPDFAELSAAGLVCLPSSCQEAPLEVAVFNVMPNKTRTAADIARLLGAAPRPVRLTFLRPRVAERCERDYLTALRRKAPERAADFAAHVAGYRTLDEVARRRFDGLLLTGAPLGPRPLETLSYWSDWCELFANADRFGLTLAICLSAMGAAKYFQGVERLLQPHKTSGVYPQDILAPADPLLRNIVFFDDCPVSRRTTLCAAQLAGTSAEILVNGPDSGVALARFAPGVVGLTIHPEYQPDTLAMEYTRDLKAHEAEPELNPRPAVPAHYFAGDDPAGELRPQRWQRTCRQLGINLVCEMEAAATRKGAAAVELERAA